MPLRTFNGQLVRTASSLTTDINCCCKDKTPPGNGCNRCFIGGECGSTIWGHPIADFVVGKDVQDWYPFNSTTANVVVLENDGACIVFRGYYSDSWLHTTFPNCTVFTWNCEYPYIDTGCDYHMDISMWSATSINRFDPTVPGNFVHVRTFLTPIALGIGTFCWHCKTNFLGHVNAPYCKDFNILFAFGVAGTGFDSTRITQYQALVRRQDGVQAGEIWVVTQGWVYDHLWTLFNLNGGVPPLNDPYYVYLLSLLTPPQWLFDLNPPIERGVWLGARP